MTERIFKLYVAGQTQRTQLAIRNLREICERDFDGRYRLTVIDVLQRPQLAENDKILATPTLLQEQPLPQRRFIGDLSNPETVRNGLDIITL